MAARRNHEKVEMADFTDALEKIVLGAPRGTVLSRRGPPARRLPRGRPRARRHAHAGRRPGPQGLDHPARPGARRHVLGARRRPRELRGVLAAGEDQGRARRPRGRGDRVRHDHHRRGVRHPAAHADRPRHGRPLGDERRDRPDRRAARRSRHGPLLPGSQPASETTQRLVDDEVRRIVEEAYARGHAAAHRAPRPARLAHRRRCCATRRSTRTRPTRRLKSPRERADTVQESTATSAPARG